MLWASRSISCVCQPPPCLPGSICRSVQQFLSAVFIVASRNRQFYTSPLLPWLFLFIYMKRFGVLLFLVWFWGGGSTFITSHFPIWELLNTTFTMPFWKLLGKLALFFISQSLLSNKQKCGIDHFFNAMFSLALENTVGWEVWCTSFLDRNNSNINYYHHSSA